MRVQNVVLLRVQTINKTYMKKSLFINICIMLVCGLFIFFSINECVNAFTGVQVLDGCSILSPGQQEALQYVWTAIRIVTPVLLVILITKDMVQAVMAGEEKQIKEAQSNAVKRIIVGIIIMFVPTIVNLILDLMGKGLDTCGIK